MLDTLLMMSDQKLEENDIMTVREKHPTVIDIIISLSDVTGARSYGHPSLSFK